MSGSEANSAYRVIFVFESSEQVERFVTEILEAQHSGHLTITGTWSWGIERVEHIDSFSQIEDLDDDDDWG